jgi:hypothetical protein
VRIQIALHLCHAPEVVTAAPICEPLADVSGCRGIARGRALTPERARRMLGGEVGGRSPPRPHPLAEGSEGAKAEKGGGRGNAAASPPCPFDRFPTRSRDRRPGAQLVHRVAGQPPALSGLALVLARHRLQVLAVVAEVRLAAALVHLAHAIGEEAGVAEGGISDYSTPSRTSAPRTPGRR